MKDSYNNKYKGYVALTAVIIISLIAVTTVAGLLLINTTGIKTDAVKRDHEEVYYTAESCVNLALNQLQTDLLYAPGAMITHDQATCEVIDILGSGNEDRTIQVEATGEHSTVRLSVEIDEVQPDVVVSNWEEVSAF